VYFTRGTFFQAGSSSRGLTVVRDTFGEVYTNVREVRRDIWPLGDRRLHVPRNQARSATRSMQYVCRANAVIVIGCRAAASWPRHMLPRPDEPTCRDSLCDRACPGANPAQIRRQSGANPALHALPESFRSPTSHAHADRPQRAQPMRCGAARPPLSGGAHGFLTPIMFLPSGTKKRRIGSSGRK